jgi:tetratricopeptide (TPR) repeat protein
MKSIKFFGLIAFFTTSFLYQMHAQTLLHIKNGCHFDGDEPTKDVYAYEASKEAIQIVSRITSAIGLEQNFTIKAADVANALANTEGGQRYILYNTTFLENFKRDAQTKWAAYCVLAHEVGHHLNNHDFSETDAKKRKILELAADRFAGNVLQKMGATLAEAQAGVNTFTLDASVTHPPKSARLEAIAVGWKQSEEKDGEKETPQYKTEKTAKLPDEKQAQAWLDKAFEESDDNLKIKYLTEALFNKPDDANALYNRGIAEENLGRNADAIEDFDASLRLNPKDDNVLCSRGGVKAKLRKFAEAITDYSAALRINSTYSAAFVGRGEAKTSLNRYAEAIEDFDQAIRLAPKEALTYNKRALANEKIGFTTAALLDYDKAIKFDPTLAVAQLNKACLLSTFSDRKSLLEASTLMEKGSALKPSLLMFYSDCKKEIERKLKL